jgi:hypothetical protein
MTLTLNATGWAYYKISDNSNKERLTVKGDGEFYVYTRKGDVPSQSFYNWFVKATSSQFLVDKDNSGEYIAFFNPDFDNKVTINVAVTNDSTIWSVMFWVCLALGGIFAFLSMINIVYFFRIKNTKNRRFAFVSQPLNSLEN